MQSAVILTDLLTVNCAFSLLLTPPPYSVGRPFPEALAEETNFRVGYVMYPTLWGIGPTLVNSNTLLYSLVHSGTLW